MKRVILSVVFLSVCLAAGAQKLMMGKRAPELRVVQWYQDALPRDGFPRYVEFFLTTSRPSLERVGEIDKLARRYGAKMDVVLLFKEKPEDILPHLNPSSDGPLIAFDNDGKSFKNFEVQYLPFAVLIDGKGVLMWSGNPSTLSDEQLEKMLK